MEGLHYVILSLTLAVLHRITPITLENTYWFTMNLISFREITINSLSFPEFSLFPTCAHGPLSQRKWIPWGQYFIACKLGIIKHNKGSLAHQKVRLALLGPNESNLKDLDFLVGNLMH